MKIDIATVKGFQDYLPDESLKRDAIAKIAEKVFRLYGFEPWETPIIEYDELMRPDTLPSQGVDEAISDRFRLQDRGGRNLGLRYEFTFQLSRILKLSPNLKLPIKRYQIGQNFRDEPIRAGRTRQFSQCDVDVLGDSSINSDAEVIALTVDILKELKIKDYKIQINNRKLLQSIIESVQIKRIQETMRELDKLDKIGADEVKLNLKKWADTNQIITLFKLLSKDLEFYKQNAFAGADELVELIELLKNYGVKAEFTPTIIRGFSYYTGNIFEFITPKKTAVIAGGRYDNSVGKYSNREIPAVGISFSLEALSGLYPKEINALPIPAIPKTLILSIEQDLAAIKLAQKLRKKNVSCSIDSRKVGKAMDYANAKNIPFVIFLGETEADSKKYKLKNMQTGKEETLTESALIKKLAKN